MLTTIKPEDVIGVLVTYQPDEAVIERVKGHLTQLERLIIVENGFGEENSALLKKYISKEKRIQLISISGNQFAFAQNMGIKKAKEMGGKAILLLDDDSEMAPEMLMHLCNAYEPHIGLLAPNMIDRDTHAESRYASTLIGPIFQRQAVGQSTHINNSFNPIASGSLIPMEAIEQVGLMDERFNIDYVDREFCLRLLVRGFGTRIVSNAMIYHRIGQGKSHEALGMTITCRHHSPQRRYTIFRNRLRCWARYGLTVPAFLSYDILACFYDLFRIVCFEEDKGAKLRAAMHGMLAAITGEDHGEYTEIS